MNTILLTWSPTRFEVGCFPCVSHFAFGDIQYVSYCLGYFLLAHRGCTGFQLVLTCFLFFFIVSFSFDLNHKS